MLGSSIMSVSNSALALSFVNGINAARVPAVIALCWFVSWGLFYHMI